MAVAEICIVVFGGIGTLLIAIPAIYMGVDYFQERQKRKRPLFTRILYEMEKMHKRKHEVNFILLSDDVRYVDFDRVMGIPVERATLPKAVNKYNGRVVKCRDMACPNCAFDSDVPCSDKRKEWAEQEH